MLVGLDTIDPANAECGLKMSLIDPTTVFPVWGGDGGLTTVYRVYLDSPHNILGNYGGAWGKEHDRIRTALRKIGNVKGEERLDPAASHTVIEVWNRDWCQVIVDEKEIANRRHGYAEVPFTIVQGGFDLPPGTAIGSAKSRDPYVLNSIWGEIAVTDRAVDIARQCRPFQWRKLRPHAIREATAARYLTTFRDFDNPTWIHEVEPMTKHLLTSEIAADPGHVIEVQLGNKLSTLVKVPGGDLIAPLEQLMLANGEQGPWSQINAGGIPPQTSDSAIGTMLELGGAAQAGFVQSLELFHQLRGEARLRRWRDWGAVLGPDGERGSLPIPNSQQTSQGAMPAHHLKPELLERTGCQLEASLFHWRPNPGLAQYIMGLRSPGGASGAPLISDETARRKLRVVQDPDRETFRIEDEMIQALPAIATQRAMRRIDAEIAAEIEAGDLENADALMVAGIELEFERQKQIMMSAAAPPPPGAGGPGDLPMGMPEESSGAMPSQPPDQQGLSQVQLGDRAGIEGGRPQGGQATQGTQAPSRVTAPER
jgi:hypothetical protein